MKFYLKKTKTYIMKKLLFIGLVIGLLSCNKEEVIEIHDANTDANDLTTAFIGLPGGGTGICSETFTLYGGQHINVGTITITNTTDSIFVTYTTQGNWILNETHLYVGSLAGLPTNKPGKPKIGHFPYQSTHQGVTSYTVAIPIDPAISCYIVAAHASVALLNNSGSTIQQETAWSKGERITKKGSWATYSEYCLLFC